MKKFSSRGFTIVELLVVIVIIGILAAITIVSYTGITQKAVAASLQADLANASQQLKIFQLTSADGGYPALIDDCPTPASGNLCLKKSNGSSYDYSRTTGASPTFSLTETNGTTAYKITDNTAPVAVVALTCPSGFVVVPGSSTYGTSDFCVMKYEAKNGGGNVPVSQAAGIPWNTISQIDATTYSANVAGCSGCHLITESEWMTIASNLLGVASNWSGGVVGSGFIYSGHNDGDPFSLLVADSTDTNGYIGTNNLAGSNQLRTLTLSNGNVIWDFAGNAQEWTSGTASSGQPGIAGASYDWREWSAITTPGTFSPNPSPMASGVAGVSGWTSANGIGKVWSDADNINLHGFPRGGAYLNGGNAGIFMLALGDSPYSALDYLGFRVAK